MSEDNVSEFPGRKPTEFDSDINKQHFSQELANLINASGSRVSVSSVVAALEVMKFDILLTQSQPAPGGFKETH